MIDEFYDYCYGALEYRSLRFETEVLDMGNYQGNAVVNYTDYEVPYTRIIEHKHFEFGTQAKTVITREYPAAWEKGKEPYYPINDPKNDELFDKYERRALEEKNVRVELDDRSEKLGYRMREGQVQKVPYLLVVGFNEKEDRTVSFRLHGEKDTTVLPLDEFVEKIDNEIKNKLRTHIGAEEK